MINDINLSKGVGLSICLPLAVVAAVAVKAAVANSAVARDTAVAVVNTRYDSTTVAMGNLQELLIIIDLLMMIGTSQT